MKRLWLALPLAFVAACGESNNPMATSESSDGGAIFPATTATEPVDWNARCTDLGFDFGYKLDQQGAAAAGTWTIPGVGTITVTTTDGATFNWSSSFGIDGVFAKGGQGGGGTLYHYAESTGDQGLRPNVNGQGIPQQISHIEFCFDLELRVSKTAATTYTRTWNWTIDKSASTSSLLLQNGETSPAVNYNVAVSSTSTDSDWNANGTISIYNPAPFAASVTSVTDVMTGDFAGAVDCGGFPAAVAAQSTLTCTYSGALPDASARLNTATVTSDASIVGTAGTGSGFYGSGSVAGGSGTADVSFGAPTTLTDESVSVGDTRHGALGNATGSGSWNYGMTFGPYSVCGEYDEGNTATFTTNDTGAQGSDNWNVHVVVTGCDNGGGDPPGGGCTLTQGYWKTHSLVGPAPYDAGWQLLGALQQNTMFYSSGQTWINVFRTAPAGNQYYVLAHQYMAAKLNQLNGASSTAAVTAAMTQANAIFTATSGVTLSKTNKALAITLAATLASYNEGTTGPGHCSE